MNYKAQPKGHIAVKSAETHPKTSSKKYFSQCYAVALCNNFPDNRKDLTLHVFPKDFCPEVSFSLNTFQSTFISGAPNNGFLLNTLITLFRLSRVLLDV